jgi:hypothetical protein
MTSTLLMAGHPYGLDFFTGLTCCFFGADGLRMRSTFHVLTTFACFGLSIFDFPSLTAQQLED